MESEEKSYKRVVGYDDAIQAIMNCPMYGRNKTKACRIVKSGQDESYYKSVIHIMHAPMYDRERLKTLESLNFNIQ